MKKREKQRKYKPLSNVDNHVENVDDYL